MILVIGGSCTHFRSIFKLCDIFLQNRQKKDYSLLTTLKVIQDTCISEVERSHPELYEENEQCVHDTTADVLFAYFQCEPTVVSECLGEDTQVVQTIYD